MRLSTEGSHLFVCPDCDERIIIDDEMRRYILAEGCAICGAEITTSDFERLR